MTKEMRPSHRIDVLTDALWHYSRCSAQRLATVYTHIIITATLLPSRREKATKIRDESREALEKLMNRLLLY